MIKVCLGDKKDRDFLNEVLALDSLVYPKKYQAQYDEIKKRYDKNTESFILVKDDNITIGYMCVFPIKNSLCEVIRLGKYQNDINLDPDNILKYQCGNEYNLYIISIVVHPSYQKNRLSELLFAGLEKYIKELNQRNINIIKILAMAISNGGYKVLKANGFEKIFIIDHNSCILQKN